MTVSVAKLKLPPHSIEAEQSLLGAAMLEPKSWAKIANHVSVEDFYRADHRVTWAAICDVQRDGLASDAVTVGERLSRLGQLGTAGGMEYLARLVEDTPSAASIESYAKIVRDYAVKRRLGVCAHNVAALVHSEHTAAEATQEAARLFGEFYGMARVGPGLVEARTLVPRLLDDLDRKRAGERGLSVGLPDFDHVSFGLEPGDLVVIAARPGMGKTALLVNIAAHVSQRAGVAIFSAEMPALQLLRRCVSLLSQIEQSRLRQPQNLAAAEWDAITEAASTIAARRLWIDDTPSPKLDHIRGEVLALQTRAQQAIALVDYVQLVQGEGANRYEQLRDVAYGLKALAKEASLPIVLLAQINRGVESRDNKRPRLADLRDSGAIEEAADIVGLLYSESYYDPDFLMPNVIECAIEKNRNGERGLCLWKFRGETSGMRALDDSERTQYRHLIAKQRRRGDEDDL